MRYAEILREDISNWFLGSKVVNPDGSPKRMYHGTGQGEITAFDPERANATALYGPGFYFTDSHEVAGSTGKSFGPNEKDEAVFHRAAWNQAGYAFQGLKYEIQPLTSKQMAHAKRIFGSQQVERECREDIGTRQIWGLGWKAFNAGEESFRGWVANSAPMWFRDRIKAVRQRINTPTVYPVYLSIKNPWEMEAEDGLEAMRELWDAWGDHEFESFENATHAYQDAYLRGGIVKRSDAWGWFVSRVIGGAHDGSGKTKANQFLQRLGYDGIHHEGGQHVGTFGNHDVWIAFKPSQIKSVFASRFDAESPHLGETR